MIKKSHFPEFSWNWAATEMLETIAAQNWLQILLGNGCDQGPNPQAFGFPNLWSWQTLSSTMRIYILSG